MTCQGVSTLARAGVPAVVVVLDNALYGIEQWLLDRGWYTRPTPEPPIPHLELHRWDYDGLARAMGMAQAVPVDTADAFAAALEAALVREVPSRSPCGCRPTTCP